MITQNQPVRFEWRNFRRSFRTAKIGDIHLIQVEVDAEVWQNLDTMPKDADGEMVIWWETRGEGVGKEKNPKPPKGAHGKFWQELHSFHNRPDVRLWLGVEVGYATEKAAINRLYEIFNVTSRTFISPDDLRDWVSKMPDCDGALTVIENAKAKT